MPDQTPPLHTPTAPSRVFESADDEAYTYYLIANQAAESISDIDRRSMFNEVWEFCKYHQAPTDAHASIVCQERDARVLELEKALRDIVRDADRDIGHHQQPIVYSRHLNAARAILTSPLEKGATQS